MACCDPFDGAEPIDHFCPDCDEPVDADGDAIIGCDRSPCVCDTCGARPCDESC